MEYRYGTSRHTCSPQQTLTQRRCSEDYNAPRGHEAATPWEGKVQDLTWTFKDDEPRFRHEQWRKVFEEQSKSTPLSLIVANEQYFALPLGEHQEPFVKWLPKEKVWERYNTISHISVLQGDEREVSGTTPRILHEDADMFLSGLIRLSWMLSMARTSRRMTTEK